MLWRYSANSPKLWLIDARLLVLMLATLMHISELTLSLSVVAICVLFYIERYKRVTPEAAVRLVLMTTLNLFIGSKRSPLGLRRKRYFSDQRFDC